MGLSAEEFAAKKAEVAAEKIAARKASNQTATQAATNQTASLAAAAEGSTDTNHATHNSYVGIRRRAMAGECEWPDDGDWPLDLFVELTDPSRISIMQRPFGEDLGSVEEDSLMSMSTSEARPCLEDIAAAMAPLLCEVQRIVLVATRDQMEHWVKVFQEMAAEENMAKRATVVSIVAFSRDCVLAAVAGFSSEAITFAFDDGECVEVSGAEMSSAIEAGRPGYMMYALLLPGYRLVDMVCEDMPGTPPQAGVDIAAIDVSAELCAPTMAPTLDQRTFLVEPETCLPCTQ